MVCNQVGITNLAVDKKKAFVGDTAINVFSHLKIMLLPWSNTQSSSNSAYSIVNSPLPVNPPHVHSMVIGILQSFLLVEDHWIIVMQLILQPLYIVMVYWNFATSAPVQDIVLHL